MAKLVEKDILSLPRPLYLLSFLSQVVVTIMIKRKQEFELHIKNLSCFFLLFFSSLVPLVILLQLCLPLNVSHLPHIS